MSTDHQPSVRIGPKPVRPVPETVRTPLGELSIQESYRPGEDTVAFETAEADCRTRLGRASASFHVECAVRDGMPITLKLSLLGGAERWLQALGEPVRRGEALVAWSASATLDPLSGLMPPGGTVSVGLSEYDVPDERRSFMLPPSVRDPGLEAEVAAEVTALIEAWARDFPGHAARTYAAMIRRHQADVEASLERQRAALIAGVDRREHAARLARAAEAAAAGRPLGVALDAATPSRDRAHIELCGFFGEPYDARNLDEIMVEAPSMVHLETMSEDAVWMGIYMADGRRLSVNVHRLPKDLAVSAEIDDDGDD